MMDVGFEPMRQVARVMHGFKRPWFVSGGWAIDLFLEKVTRAHSDVEIGVYRCDQSVLQRHLARWHLEKAIATQSGGEWARWKEDEALELPIHQVRVSRNPGEELAEFEIFLNECRDGVWLSRRHADLQRPMKEVWQLSTTGVPMLTPEIQLLYKAKYRREKDEADFANALPRLSSAQRTWLAEGLRLCHPGHGWLEKVGELRE